MNFEFATAGRIVFGSGSSRNLADLIPGQRLFLLTGGNPGRIEGIVSHLRQTKTVTVFPVSGEPTVEVVEQAVQSAKSTECNAVAGIGGGSVLDAGKVVAALLTNPGPVLDYLETVGSGKPLSRQPLFYAAVPTTAGTGTEATRNAVILSTKHKVKVSLRHTRLLPALAVIDPRLTFSAPPELTATTGLDTLTQLIEPFTSLRANPMIDLVCEDGMRRIVRSLERAFRDGSDLSAREDMALAALYSGMALANAGLGAVHGIAGPLGGRLGAPHGAVCAALLAPVLEANIHKLHQLKPDSPGRVRYRTLAEILTGNPDVNAEDGPDWIRDLIQKFGLGGLSRFGLTPGLFPELIAQSLKSASMKSNPVSLDAEDLEWIFNQAMA